MKAAVFILAGEPSGDKLAAHIMRVINQHYKNIEWVGVGGSSMCDEGLDSLVDMEKLSVIGFGEALLSYRRLTLLANALVEHVISKKPKLIITVDNKGFSMRFATLLRSRMKSIGWSVPIVHCVAPTVWAWGSWRAKKFAMAMDGLLCLFPFEPRYFQKFCLNAKFIGHPEAFENYSPRKPSKKNLGGSRKIILLPGSRRSEIKFILPEMLLASAILKQHDPRFSFVLAAVPHLLPMINAYAKGYDIDIQDCEDDLIPALQSSDAMMATTGTITLQAALCGTAGITCYRTGAFSAFIGRQLVDLDRVVLPNVILEQKLYPFYFQKEASAKVLASALLDVLDDKTAMERSYRAAFKLKGLLTKDKEVFSDLVLDAMNPWLQKLG